MGKKWLTKISPGNTKLGDIPSVSLSPSVTCIKDAPCKKYCYARRYLRRYPTAANAYEYNWELLQMDRDKYFNDIYEYIDYHRPKRFRWHVAGDIPDQDYLYRLIDVVRLTPFTRHTFYTKRYDIEFPLILPDNLRAWFSMWPGWSPPRIPLKLKAWMQDGTENRIPSNAYICPMDCRRCAFCWYGYRDVIFHKH